jgi:Concanavalin A-like lectin/glucanases superfamily
VKSLAAWSPKNWRVAGIVALVGAGVVISGAALSQHGRAAGNGVDSCQPQAATPGSQVTDSYDRQVLSLGPVAYLTMSNPQSRAEPDLSGHGHTGTYFPPGDLPGTVPLPNGDPAANFDGQGQYLQVPSAAELSIPHTGCLTVEAWIRPGTLQFTREQGSGYVYILGKGVTGRQEYAMRMYSRTNEEHPPRPNRISAYVWNLWGGEGSGSYFQDPVTMGQWIMVAFVVDSRPSPAWPQGYIAIYKDGQWRGQVSLSQFHVTPEASDAPFRVASRDLESFFQGAIGKVAVYDWPLPASDIDATYQAMYAS